MNVDRESLGEVTREIVGDWQAARAQARAASAEKLRAAERLIGEVRDTLNKERHECELCGLTVYHSQTEWVQRQMLNAAIQRVGKVAGEMEKPENAGQKTA